MHEKNAKTDHFLNQTASRGDGKIEGNFSSVKTRKTLIWSKTAIGGWQIGKNLELAQTESLNVFVLLGYSHNCWMNVSLDSIVLWTSSQPEWTTRLQDGWPKWGRSPLSLPTRHRSKKNLKESRIENHRRIPRRKAVQIDPECAEEQLSSFNRHIRNARKGHQATKKRLFES